MQTFITGRLREILSNVQCYIKTITPLQKIRRLSRSKSENYSILGNRIGQATHGIHFAKIKLIFLYFTETPDLLLLLNKKMLSLILLFHLDIRVLKTNV